MGTLNTDADAKYNAILVFEKLSSLLYLYSGFMEFDK